MGIIGRLQRRIAGQLDNSRYQTPGPRYGKADYHAAWISSDWLQSIQSVSEPSKISRGRVIVHAPTLSLLITGSTRVNPDPPNEDLTVPAA